ncbi:dipeptide/oligopeptide/nickel ABC transporter permease/ATP-binding protein [Actinomadura livida]|uniref:Dipeptide/oligopeptide/nickel ABC transporter permease/ATP-binding protein n=1 Tax=Actinomadura livida TaxID=79909 RepID=A0A7W7IFC2_9ACTN|nr:MULTISPECIES: dipeptide/oligopeptide/nickel ABC transporter permease/ATP-binding protein [Actinomadura]MBB4776081.1 peptide/nickel transport system permease protein [Actinomadura catellatispora]GGU15631.1 dipeptide/oligopeptide/nickel ABC transporter ATP-binding protein [Actinomadura livida]
MSAAEASGARFTARLLRSKATLLWAAVVGLVLFCAVLAPVIAPYDPLDGDVREGLLGPSGDHWLGTDKLGRDVFSRIVYGAQVALLSGAEAVGIAAAIGIPLGLLSGYAGGWTDRILMRIVEGVMSVPFLVLAIALISVLGPGLWKSMAVVGVVFAMTLMRLTRGETLAAREELYVDGARVVGAGAPRILFRHILPNITPPLIVQVTLMIAGAIIAEATLSFLGLGAQAGHASWGSMLADAQESIRQSFFLALPPGIAILVTVLAFNQVGDGVRDLFAREAKAGTLGVNPVHRGKGAEAEADPPAGTAVPDPLLSVRDLTVSFPQPGGGRVTVVQGVSLDVGKGEILGLVGESGSGKSVTAMSLLGLVPDPGRVAASTVRLDGRELTGLPFDELRKVRGRELGVVFQEPIASLNPAYTVGDQVAEVLREHDGLSRAQARERVVELFEQVHIPNPADRLGDYPHQFSGGMAQRVMIAMALACRPRLLVADEPTTALDVTVQGQVLDLLLELREQTGMSILLITHDLGVVADVADRVAVMYAGQLVECGPTEEVFRKPSHPYTEGLLTSLPRNVRRTGRLPSIPGVVPAPDAWPEGCHFADRCPHARPRCSGGPIELAAAPGGRATRCVRAEELTLTGVGGTGAVQIAKKP